MALSLSSRGMILHPAQGFAPPFLYVHLTHLPDHNISKATGPLPFSTCKYNIGHSPFFVKRKRTGFSQIFHTPSHLPSKFNESSISN